MAVTGGVCVLCIHIINLKFNIKNFFKKCLIGCIIITVIEFFVGCIVNLTLKLNVWDYSKVDFNILGQICLLYSAYWFLLCIPIVILSNLIKNKLYVIEKSQEKVKKLSVK